MNNPTVQSKGSATGSNAATIANKYSLLARRCSDAELSEKCQQIANHLNQKQGNV